MRKFVHPFGLAQVHVSLSFLSQLVKKSQAGGGVVVKIGHGAHQSTKVYGRHFSDKDEIYSHISRQSIDVLKVC